jgi:hypothetical protein
MDVNTRLRISTLVGASAVLLASLTLANPASAKRPTSPDGKPGVHSRRTPSVDGDRLLVIPVSGIAAGRHGGVIRFTSGERVLRSVRYYFDSGEADKQSLLLPVDGGDGGFVQRLLRIAEDPASSVEVGVSLDGREYSRFTLAEVEDMSREYLSQGTALPIVTLRFAQNFVSATPAPKRTNASPLAPECDPEHLEVVEQEYGECLDRCDDGQAGPTESCINECEFNYWLRTLVELEDEFTEENLVSAVLLSGDNPECLKTRTGWGMLWKGDWYDKYQRSLRVRTIRRWYVCGQIVDEVVSESLVSDICYQFRAMGECSHHGNELPCQFWDWPLPG